MAPRRVSTLSRRKSLATRSAQLRVKIRRMSDMIDEGATLDQLAEVFTKEGGSDLSTRRSRIKDFIKKYGLKEPEA